MKERFEFFNYPSMLMQGYMQENIRKLIISRIIDFGVAEFVEKCSNCDELARTLILENDKEETPEFICDALEAIEVYPGENYGTWGELDDDIVESVEQLLTAHNELREYAKEIHAKRLIDKVIKITYRNGYNHKDNFKEYIKIKESLPKNSPYSTMKKENAFRYRDENFDEFKHMAHSLAIGLHSLLGKKRIMQTNMQMALKRALGYAGYHDKIKNKERQIIAKYSTRKRWARLIRELENNWGLLYHRSKGFYFSFENKMSLEAFGKHIKDKKEKKSKSELKQAKLKELLK